MNEELQAKFKEAYELRFADDDIEWKDLGFGTKLAYLNWAVAWRAMKEVYPDCNYRLVEDANGNPLWNINGYGMLKCAVSACGVEHIETFPIMDNKNNGMKVEEIDSRDVNDSMQRGLTKAVARFGIGLYIYEGKCEAKAPKTAPKPFRAAEAPKPSTYATDTASAPQTASYAPSAERMATDKQLGFIRKLMGLKGISGEEMALDPTLRINPNADKLTAKQASQVIDWLNLQPVKASPAQEDDLPF